MKDIVTYIFEERLKDNLVIWDCIEVPKEGYSEKWAEKAIEEMLSELEKKVIAAIILSVENENNENLQKYEIQVRKAAELAGSQYKKFLKLNNEEKTKWIEDKIQSIKDNSEKDKQFKRKWNLYAKPSKGTSKNPIIWKPTLKEADHINIENSHINIHNNITSQYSSNQVSFSRNYKQLANKIISYFPKYPDDCLEHLQKIYIYTNDKSLFSLQIFHITFGFDDEYEDKLDKSVKKFGDFMSSEYNSGRYMGD